MTSRLHHAALAALAATLFFIVIVQAEAPDPQVRVETLPRWRSATLSIYIFGMPGDGAEYTQDSITLRVAVWGADEDNPLIIQLDGEEAARITYEGLFTYEWTIRGSHHLLLRDRYKIFDQATFNVKAPPPPPALIPVSAFEERLEEQFTGMLMAMVAATALGVPSGIWLKKRTKITSQWALTVPAVGVGIGARYLPDLYMLVPWGIAAALAYQLAKPYAVSRGLLRLEANGIQLDHMYLDDDGYRVEGVSPRYWRDGFVKRRKLEIIDEYPVLVTGRGMNLTSLCVKKVTESEEVTRVECDRSLAMVLMVRNVVEELSEENTKLKARNTILESIGSALSSAKIRQEVDARLIGIMQGELGRVNPKAILEGLKELEARMEKEAGA